MPGTGLGMWRDDTTSRLFEARRGDDIPEEIRDDIEDARIILISKSRMESRIHRHGRLDRVLVKEHDDRGAGDGLHDHRRALHRRGSCGRPARRSRCSRSGSHEILDRVGVTYGSHDHRAMVAAFDSAPVEFLIGAEVDSIADLIRELVEAEGSKLVRLVLRTDPRGRPLYAAVLLPRERYREDLRDAGPPAARGAHRRQLHRRPHLLHRRGHRGPPLLLHRGRTGARLEPDAAGSRGAGARAVLALGGPAARRAAPTATARMRAPSSRRATRPPSPRRSASRPTPTTPCATSRPSRRSPRAGEPQFALYFDHGDARARHRDAAHLPGRAAAALRPPARRRPLRDPRRRRAAGRGRAGRPAGGGRSSRCASCRSAPTRTTSTPSPRGSPRRSARRSPGPCPSDPLNGLVLGAGLDWREVDCVRAYLEYFIQIQGALTRPFLRTVLLENPLAVRILVRYLEARLDPALSTARRTAGARQRLRALRELPRPHPRAERGPRARRPLRADRGDAAHELLRAAREAAPHRRSSSTPRRVPELAGAVPYREIFVHSAEIDGHPPARRPGGARRAALERPPRRPARRDARA